MSKKNKQNPADLPYRPCVGIVVFNKAGKVWAGKRVAMKNSDLTNNHNFWQFPQGGIDKGEDSYQAALRELWEETGINQICLLKEVDHWLTYDLPEQLIGKMWKGKYRGQKQKWFAFLFQGNDEDIMINPPPNGNQAEFDSWQWLEIEQLTNLVVAFKKSVYEEVIQQFAPIAQQLKQDSKL